MKMDTTDLVQHTNAVALLVFCVSYSFVSFTVDPVTGVFVWATALPFLYLPDLVIIPEVPKDEMKEARKVSIPAAWVWVLWWIGMFPESILLRIVAGVLFAVLTVYGIFFVRKWKKEYACRKHGEEKPMNSHG